MKAFLRDCIIKPRFKGITVLLIAPKTNHWGLVGTAFDYLFRFYVKNLNPDAIEGKWAAYGTLNIVRDDIEIYHAALDILRESEINYSNYKKSGIISTNLVISTPQLAQLDAIYRGGWYPSGEIGNVDENDIIDLKQLISIIQPLLFIAKEKCILNPFFSYSSYIIGGADADLIVDNTLIEIKTTKHHTFKRSYFNQLICYLALIEIEKNFFKEFKIQNYPCWCLNCKIDKLGIYYSRFGDLDIINVNDIFPTRESLLDFSRAIEDLIITTQGFEQSIEQKREIIKILLESPESEESFDKPKPRGRPLVKGRYRKPTPPEVAWYKPPKLWKVIQSMESTRPPGPHNKLKTKK